MARSPAPLSPLERFSVERSIGTSTHASSAAAPLPPAAPPRAPGAPRGKGPRCTVEGLGVESVELVDYVYAGTSKAYEHLGGGDFHKPACVCCGSRIAHVFVTNAGPMGGDCVASLTGDNATRSEIRRTVPKLLRAIRDGSGFGRMNQIRIQPTGTIWGRYTDSGRETAIGSARDAKTARMAAGAAVEQFVQEHPAFAVPNVPRIVG